MEEECKMKEFYKKNENKIWIIILLLVLLIQVGIRVYFGNEKAYLQMDEGYSYGLMNYNKVDLMDNENFYETWHRAEYYQDYLSISSEEAFDLKPVYENQKNDVHPPLYYALLRTAASFTIDSFSKWTGIIVNIILFIISTIILYCLAYRILKNKFYALITILINGISIASIDSTVFIRMYALNALNVILIAYWHIRLYKKELLGAKELVPLAIFTVLGSLTHYYYLLFLFILAVMFVIRYIRTKNWKNMIRYVITMIISGILSLVVFPYSFVHIFMGYRGQGAISSLEHVEKMWNSLGRYLGILNNSCFNGILIVILLGIFFIVIAKLLKNRKVTIHIKNSEIWYIVLPTLIYFMIVSIVSPYQEVRYIIPICPLIIMLFVYLIKVVLESITDRKRTLLTMGVIFVLMLLTPILFHIPVDYLYLGEAEGIEKTIELHELPTIYIMNMNQNRFLDDLYLFSKLDESYIMDAQTCTVEKLKKVLTQKDTSKGMLIFINEGIIHNDYLQQIQEVTSLHNIEHIQKMNACNIYHIF